MANDNFRFALAEKCAKCEDAWRGKEFGNFFVSSYRDTSFMSEREKLRQNTPLLRLIMEKFRKCESGERERK